MAKARGLWALMVGLLVAGSLTILGPLMAAQGAAEQGFQFAVIGDLGYNAAQESLLANVLDELNRAPLDFVFHVGDLSSDAFACRDEDYFKRLAQFQASVHPFIYTPGDNDWTDCHRARSQRPTFDPVERLGRIRELFFTNEETLGRRTVPVWRQSRNPEYAKFRENARFAFRDIMVMTINQPGSNNNFGRTPEMDAEFAERNQANVVWLIDGFDEAKRQGSRGVLIFMQANIFGEFTPADPVSGFANFKSHLLRETIAFGKPVVLFHGDTHYFRVDKPLGYSGAAVDAQGNVVQQLENFTRVEGFGQPSHHWVHVTVDPNDPGLFTIRPRIVEKNKFQPPR